MHILNIAVLLILQLSFVVQAVYDFNRFSKHIELFPKYIAFRDKIVEKVRQKDLTFLNQEALQQAGDAVYYLWLHEIPGDISEFGVYKGGASIVMASVLFFLEPGTTRKCHLFDSFEGHPNYKATADKDFDLVEWGGKVIGPIQGVIDALKEFGLHDQLESKRIILHKGWFKDTAPNLRRPLALLRADGDAYTSTMDTLTNAYKHLAIGGLVIVDDYDTYQSCRNAVIDFFKAENISMKALIEPGHLATSPKVFWTKTA